MHDVNAAAVEALNDYRTGVYTSDDLPGTALVFVFVDGRPREIGRIMVHDAGEADKFVGQCFRTFCDRNGIGERKVVRIAAKNEYAYPTQFKCLWCGTIRLGYDIQRADTMSVERCSHYVIWVTRPGYDRVRDMRHLGLHLTYQRRPALETT